MPAANAETGEQVSDDAQDVDRDSREGHEPSEITYDEQFYPARPRRLKPRARLRGLFSRPKMGRNGKPTGDNPAYVSWLVQESMLDDARAIASQFSGTGSRVSETSASPSRASTSARSGSSSPGP